MHHSIRKVLSPALQLSVLALFSCSFASAQRHAAKAAPIFGHGNVVNPYADVSVTIASVPNGAFTTALLAVFANDTALSYGVSLNGTDSVYSSSSTGMPGMSCSPISVITCTASIAVYNGTIYIAYVDKETQGLDVLVAQPIPGQPNYNLQLFHQDSTFAMTSSPSMSVYRGYLVIYFSAQTATVPNGFFGVGFDGTTWQNMRQVAAF